MCWEDCVAKQNPNLSHPTSPVSLCCHRELKRSSGFCFLRGGRCPLGLEEAIAPVTAHKDTALCFGRCGLVETQWSHGPFKVACTWLTSIARAVWLWIVRQLPISGQHLWLSWILSLFDFKSHMPKSLTPLLIKLRTEETMGCWAMVTSGAPWKDDSCSLQNKTTVLIPCFLKWDMNRSGFSW